MSKKQLVENHFVIETVQNAVAASRVYKDEDKAIEVFRGIVKENWNSDNADYHDVIDDLVNDGVYENESGYRVTLFTSTQIEEVYYA